MIRLIVRGQELDLFKEEVFAVSKAVSKLGEFDKRHGDVSIIYKVPPTNKNNAIFRYLSSLNNHNQGGFKKHEGQLIEDESVVSTGYFQVLKVEPRRSITVRFYGGNSDWFDLLRDRDINKTYLNTEPGPNKKTYSLQSLNHKFESSVIVSSWDNEEGYFYFPVDNGKNTGKLNNILSNEDFQVGIFQHTIVKQIFDSIGIKIKGSLFNDPIYYNTLINRPIDISVFDRQNNDKRFTTVLGSPIEKTLTPINYPNNDQDSQWNGNTFTSESDIDSLNFEIRVITSNGSAGGYGTSQLTIKYTINGVPQADKVVDLDVIDSTIVAGIDYLLYSVDYEETDPFLNVKIGDTFEFFLKNIGNIHPPIADPVRMVDTFEFPNFGNNQSYLSYEIEGAITEFDITNAIPQINQATFIKDVMFRHGVISEYNAKTRTLTLNKFEDIGNNKVNSVDYSDKIDLLKPPVYDFEKVLSGFKKTSKIVYKQDDNDLLMSLFRAIFKRNLGDAVIEIDNDNLSGEGVIFESVFSGTLQNWTWSDEFYIPTVPIFKPTDGGNFELQELNARIFVRAGKIPVTSFRSSAFTSITFDGTPYTQIGYAFFAKQLLNKSGMVDFSLNSNTETLSFDNINRSSTNYIGRTILEKNYKLYFDILKSPIHLSINLNLKAIDIQEIDFLKPVWLNFSLDSGYYYLNNINQYKGDGSSTTVELVKL